MRLYRKEPAMRLLPFPIAAVCVVLLGSAAPNASFLVNGDLSDWSDGAPSHWLWRAPSPVVSLLAEERAGKPVISLRESNALFQDLIDNTLREGDRIIFEGYFRSGEDLRAQIDVRAMYRNPETNEREMREHSVYRIPSGGWQYARVMLRVPEDGPEYVRVGVHMAADMRSPLLVSGLRAYVVPAMP
jgi:hypothetical protein